MIFPVLDRKPNPNQKQKNGRDKAKTNQVEGIAPEKIFGKKDQ
jgi:hypothetical protein